MAESCKCHGLSEKKRQNSCILNQMTQCIFLNMSNKISIKRIKVVKFPIGFI